jgi:hypothetical protein
VTAISEIVCDETQFTSPELIRPFDIVCMATTHDATGHCPFNNLSTRTCWWFSFCRRDRT